MRIVDLAGAAHSDPHLQAMSAMSLSPGDVVVAISQSGRSTSLLPSRIAHLAVGVSIMKGEQVDRHLGKLNRGLQSLRKME